MHLSLAARGAGALLTAVLLPLYAIAMVVVVRRRSWDLWDAFTFGNAALGILAAAVATLLGAWPDVLGHPAGRAVVAGAVAGAAMALPIVALVWLPGRLGRSLGTAGVGGVAAGRLAYRLVVQVLICTVLFEELAFRGLLYALLAGMMGQGARLAMVGTTASFALWHSALLADMFAGWKIGRRLALVAAGLLAYGALGAVLAALRAATGTLLGPLAAHGALDLLMIGGMALRAGVGHTRHARPLPLATMRDPEG